MIICPKCKQSHDDNVQFCAVCGMTMTADSTIPESTIEPKKKRLPKKAKIGIGIGGAVSAVVVAVVLLLTMIVPPVVSHPIGVFYIKDSELHFLPHGGEQAWRLTDEMLSNDPRDWKDTDEALPYLFGNGGHSLSFTKDGTHLLYADDIDTNTNDWTLYYRDLTDSAFKPIKIDTNIKEYDFSEKGDMVIYLTQDGELYSHNLDEKERIASNVIDHYVSVDCKRVVYLERDESGTSSTLYYVEHGKEKVKIANNVYRVKHCNEKLDTFFYLDDHNILYRRQHDGRIDQIDTDVWSLDFVYETGEMYYLKNSQWTKMSDFIEDDMPEGDELLSRLRAELGATANYIFELWYFDGKNTVQISTSVVANNITRSQFQLENAEDTAVVAFTETGSMPNKIKLSALVDTLKEAEIYDMTNVSRMGMINRWIGDAQMKGASRCVAVGSSRFVLEADAGNVFNLSLTDDGKKLYYKTTDLRKNGDFYCAIIQNGKLQKTELLDEDVSEFELLSDGTIAYLKNYNEDTWDGDLYVDGKKIDEKASFLHGFEDGTILYEKTDDTGSTNYKLFKNGKTIEIGISVENMYSYVPLSPSLIYFLDYDEGKGEGDLYRYEDGEVVLVDDNVQWLLISMFDTSGSRLYY